MLKTQHKSKGVSKAKLSRLRIVDFDDNDLQSNALGIITAHQKKELYKQWNKTHFNPTYLYIVVFPLLTSATKPLGDNFSSTLLGITVMFVAVYFTHQYLKDHVSKDVKIKSFIAIARPYQDDKKQYLTFDDVMTFEIKDQPNKLFKPEQSYRVFMTDKDNIILSARTLDS